MKSLLTLILAFLSIQSFAQGSQQKSVDTLSSQTNYQGIRLVITSNGKDTLAHSYYKNGQLEGSRTISMNTKLSDYTRYYPNGKIMWQMTLNNMIPDGKARYYNNSGRKIAEFNWVNGSIADTLFLDPKQHFLLGRGTYYSVVYGGMEREDGSSNISGGEGVYIYRDFYTVKLNKTAKSQVKDQAFQTDFNGYFMVLLDKGHYGIFPESYKIENVQPNMASPMDDLGGSINSSWNLEEPLNFDSKSFQYLPLHFHSVGYAP